jgi:hypothetical protein
MQPALHITTQILPGNKIEIEIPEAGIGDTVNVFIVLPEKAQSNRRSVMEILEEVHAKRQPRSAEEIDRQLQEERDSWDS